MRSVLRLALVCCFAAGCQWHSPETQHPYTVMDREGGSVVDRHVVVPIAYFRPRDHAAIRDLFSDFVRDRRRYLIMGRLVLSTKYADSGSPNRFGPLAEVFYVGDRVAMKISVEKSVHTTIMAGGDPHLWKVDGSDFILEGFRFRDETGSGLQFDFVASELPSLNTAKRLTDTVRDQIHPERIVIAVVRQSPLQEVKPFWNLPEITGARGAYVICYDRNGIGIKCEARPAIPPGTPWL